MTEHPTGWRNAVVRTVAHPTPRTVTLRLEVPNRLEHRPGQHYVVRLTAEDGYQAARSYSVASAPADPLVELCVERLDDGEVSGFLAEGVAPGDALEVRGPLGGWFVWDADRPALAVGGGTGVVPLVSMLRHAGGMGRLDLLHVVAAGRTMVDLPYSAELAAAGATLALSRQDLPDRPAGRLGSQDLAPLVRDEATAYVCGSAAFAEAASQQLVGLGVPAGAIRVERFGPSA